MTARYDPGDDGLLFRRELPAFRLVVVTASREIHEFAHPRDGFDKVSVVGNELPFFWDCSKLWCRALFKSSTSRWAFPSAALIGESVLPGQLPGLNRLQSCF